MDLQKTPTDDVLYRYLIVWIRIDHLHHIEVIHIHMWYDITISNTFSTMMAGSNMQYFRQFEMLDKYMYGSLDQDFKILQN